ncbi:hypothetical protein O2W14_17015 [Modestobacter sp. VKM Ac-2986]|uniref:hypothetical protein n=1 Tax=Modestobacter sp. VKM Ac-2986 TaxID=3004140 RepID=UPI0022AB7AD5|nr:hypothetical protein [Modestobacter sp. VKM Ac-2986]MCZ2830540.1 hypothetical protein [Modestobacter sp. VKM Ac-2986]
MEHVRHGNAPRLEPPTAPPGAAQALDAADDALAVEAGRQLARWRDDASGSTHWPASRRVERCVGPTRLVLEAWVSRR